jgi:hypothetical protein
VPRRWIDPDLFTDEKLAKATLAERYLFAAMIANQDDDGRLLGHPGYLRSIAFPYDDYTKEEVKEMRDHLAEVNPNVIIYNNSGDEYIQLRRHARYQQPRYYHKSKFPAPPGWPFEIEPPKNDDKGDVEKTIRYEIANKLRSGQWQPTNEEIKYVELNKRLGNLYADIFATTVSQTYILIEVKQYPLQLRDLGQILGYRKEAETRALTPIKTYLIGKGLGNLSLEEALSSSVTVLNLDLTEIKSVTSTGEDVSVTTGKDVDVTRYTEDRVGRGGVRSGLDLDKGKGNRIPAVSGAVQAPPLAPGESKEADTEKIAARKRTKPKQAEAGIFLDMIQRHIGTKLVQRAKLHALIRPLLVKFPEATPESLFECFKWLKQNDPYCRARDSPMVVSLLPSKYPEWVAGKLLAGGKEERYSRLGEHKQRTGQSTELPKWQELPEDAEFST